MSRIYIYRDVHIPGTFLNWEPLDLATLDGWTGLIKSAMGDGPPAEAEAIYYQQIRELVVAA